MNSKDTAVAYYRMSTDKQEASIPEQRRAVEAYARTHGYQIVREYVDEAVSGWKTTQRKGFTQLISDAEGGSFKAVLCWDIDRFSRFDPLEANHYWYLLDKSGVTLATVAQGKLDWHDLGGWLSASVQQHGKAQYVKDLSRNVARGVKAKKLAGRWFGPAPFGYRFEDGRLHLGDPEAIALVRRIFERRAKGLTLSAICRELNSEGITTPKGVHWKTVHLRCILDRPAYRGITIIGKHSSAKFSKTTAVPIEVPDTHPAIIDADTWQRVQAMPRLVRSDNGRGGGSGGRLGGLVFCDRCGGSMYCNKVTGGNAYYLCSSYHNGRQKAGKSCGHCSVRRDRFEAAVEDAIRDKVFEGSRERLEASIARQLKGRTRSLADQASQSKRAELRRLEKQVSTATEQLLLLDPDLLPTAQVKLRELIERRDRVAASLAASEAPKRRELSPAQIADQLWSLPQAMSEGSLAEGRAAMQLLIDRIDVGFEPDHERSTPKRKRFRCTGASVLLRSSDGQGIDR